MVILTMKRRRRKICERINLEHTKNTELQTIIHRQFHKFFCNFFSTYSCLTYQRALPEDKRNPLLGWKIFWFLLLLVDFNVQRYQNFCTLEQSWAGALVDRAKNPGIWCQFFFFHSFMALITIYIRDKLYVTFIKYNVCFL